MTPIVSVIVPNYNHAHYLRQRIESILNQTFQNFELILLDDCSTDGSQDLLNEYSRNPRVGHLLFNQSNSGSPFAQWAKGIALARGEWVWIAESDDWAEPTFLGTMMAAATMMRDCSLLYCASEATDEKGQAIWTQRLEDRVWQGDEFAFAKLLAFNSVVNVSACLIRRDAVREDVLQSIGQMKYCGDWMFYESLAEHGAVCQVSSVLNHYRQHSTNTTHRAEHEGLTLLEGVDVLDRFRRHFHVRPSQYARAWGRLWANYERQYGFSESVNRQIQNRLRKDYPSILFFYKLYHLKKCLA